MYRLTKRVFLALSLMIFSIIQLESQDCGLENTIVLEDLSTTSVTIIVDGLTNPILGDNGQALCKVNVEMTHEYIGDLIVELTSPSGQSVILMGPPTSNSSQTDQITWDVGFVPCLFPATPDVGIDETWNNFSNWLTFTTYQGCYYPFNGCLEDFNGQDANGVWSVTFTDDSQIGAGNLINFELIFCDQDGLQCIDCQADGGALTEDFFSFCESDQDIQIEVTPDYTLASEPDPSDYGYTVVISNDQDEIIEYSTAPDLLGYAAGTYNLCGLSYYLNQQDILPTGAVYKDSINTLINLGRLCAAFSSGCVTVDILPTKDTLFMSESLCRGLDLEVGGEVFDETGIYTINIFTMDCDSIVILDLEILDLEAVIDQPLETLSCATSSIQLIGDNSVYNAVTDIEWKTTDGTIASDSSLLTIDIESGGTYWLTLSNVDCVDSISIVVDDALAGPQLDIMADVLSCADPLGMIEMSSSTNLTGIIWNGPAGFVSTDSSFEVDLPGVYDVTVIDDNECVVKSSIEVTYSYQLDVPTFTIDSIECGQDFIQVNTQIDNEASYLFSWTNDAGYTSGDVSPQVPTPGFYYLEITQNNCSELHLVEVEKKESAPYELTSISNITCTTIGQILLDVVESYDNVQFKGPNGFAGSDLQFTTDQAGIYTMCLEMSDGCSYVDSIEITSFTQPAELILRDTFVGCLDAAVEMSVQSIHDLKDYIWEGPNGFASIDANPQVIDLGTYYLTVTSAWSNCVTLDTFELKENINAPVLGVNGVLTVDCNNPQTTIEIESDRDVILYQWDGPQTVGNVGIESLSQGGNYTVLVTADNGCTDEISFTIDRVDDTPIYQLFATDITCLNQGEGAINTIAQEPDFMYDWSGPSNFMSAMSDFTVTEAGRYTVTVTDPNGCTNETSIDLESYVDNPIITNVIEGSLNCAFGNIIIGVETDAAIETWQWSGPSNFEFDEQFPLISEEGNYAVSMIDSFGCNTNYDFDIRLDTIKPIVQVSGSEIDCNESKATLSFISNETDINYFWTGPNGYMSDLASPVVNEPGIYAINVYGSNECGTIQEFEVVENFTEPDVVAFDGSLPCDGSPLMLPVSSTDLGTTFQWFGDNFYSEEQSPEVLEMGQYIVVATGLNGCIRRDTSMVDDNPIPPEFSFVTGNLSCIDQEVTLEALNVSDDQSVRWLSPDGTESASEEFTVDAAGDYSLIVTSIYGCLDTAIVTVGLDVLEPLALAATGEELRCEVESIRLDGTGSDLGTFYEPSWIAIDGGIILDGADTHRPLVEGAGSYILSIEDTRNGCVGSDTLVIERFGNSMTEIIVDAEAPSCIDYNNGSVHILDVLGADAMLRYSINEGFFNTNPDFLFLAPGEYLITVRDSFGCEIDTLVSVPEADDIQVDLGQDLLIDLGDTATVNAAINFPIAEIQDIKWSYADINCSYAECTDITLSPLETLQLNVEITNNNGCTAEDFMIIRIEDKSPLYVPNAFSPNGDDNNDFFMIYGGKGVVQIDFINILDRWGNIVFEDFDFSPEDITHSWDGIYRGEPLPAGVYSYIFTYGLIDGSTRQVAGTITLLR